MSVINLNRENFESEVVKSNQTVIVDFYATWCAPCRMMSPIIDAIAEELNGTIKVGKVDCDENQELAISYSVMSIPTIIIFKEGKVAKQFVGVTDKTELMEAIK
ncbi:MAG: thioredoxin [Clostridia bacterium]|nr:thioredoxin [Clostridia bacterium]